MLGAPVEQGREGKRETKGLWLLFQLPAWSTIFHLSISLFYVFDCECFITGMQNRQQHLLHIFICSDDNFCQKSSIWNSNLRLSGVERGLKRGELYFQLSTPPCFSQMSAASTKLTRWESSLTRRRFPKKKSCTCNRTHVEPALVQKTSWCFKKVSTTAETSNVVKTLNRI